jgi:3-hydroxymyristoyl/3-hydroxydecanoyl-(acyl carrier protein) dehydratase
MSDHFAAFSFVDRITEFVPGTRARGVFAVPRALDAFPSCLVAEAVGQLAAWTAMAHIGFRGRPVAALANDTRFAGDVAPGEMLDLAVEIESCDDDAVAYAGSARCGERKVIDLIDCLGPMLPVEEFDSPAAMAERLALLRGPGATPGRFHGVALPELVAGPGVRGESATATLHVPTAAPFFADHFPRRPVFPATLLLDTQIRHALALAAETVQCPAGSHPVPVRMTHVKMRSFIAPGDVLELAARTAPADNDNGKLMLSAQTNGRTVATARLEFTATAQE